MTSSEVNYEHDIMIDPDALDVEWIDQPNRMWRYAKLVADRRKEVDIAKENVDYILAELDKKVRVNPERYGIERVTEPAVKNAILGSDEYQEANRRHIEAKYQYEIARAAAQAIEQRKDALENLVQLHRQSYFAGPSVPRDLSREWERKQQEKGSDEKIAAATMKFRRRKPVVNV